MHNIVYLIGRLANDIELEKKIASITLAVQRTYKNEEGIYETDFIDCILYNQVASHTSKYCHKGDLVGVKGRLQTHGEKELKVVVDKISFLCSKKSEDNED